MKRAGTFKYILLSSIFATVAVGVAPARAQSASEAATGEIIVTARKRNETSIDVPVAIAALGEEQLNRYGARDFQAVATQIPGLIIQPIPGGGGGSIALRGISSTPSNPSIDQAVSFNVDGVQVGSANILRLGQIDLQQIEVLKGPQALFFGKNSPGGVISLRTNDPGDHFEFKAITDYEFNARELGITAIASSPLTDTLGVRVVGYFNTMKGYFENHGGTFPGFNFGPVSSRGPKKQEFYLRGTLLFKPTDALTIRAKYGYSKLDADSSPFDTQQRIYCSRGTPQMLGYPGPQDCKADKVFFNGKMDPRLVAFLPAGSFDDEGTRSTQQLGSLEIGYEMVPDITLTSVSGYYKIHDEFYGSASYQSSTPLVSGTLVNRRELSEEVRLASARDDWPVNFTVGAYVQDSKFYQETPTVIDGYAFGLQPAPGLGFASRSFNQFWVKGSSYSFFGQLIWKVFDKLEVAGGARWSHERKRVRGHLLTGPVVFGTDDLKFTDTSPEVTVTYKPNANLSIFGAFRNGFKSGGFSTGGSFFPVGVPLDYRPEDAQGFEAGIKARTGGLRFNITAYTYRYKDMQLSTFDPVRLFQSVVNAASARVKGIEADFNWNTPVQGLDLHGSVNYNHARYSEFLVGCYTGQTVAEGCDQNPSAAGVFRNQDFAGHQLVLAPDWTGNAGASYTGEIGGDLKLGLTGDASFSDNFFGQLESAPFARQKGFAMFDASVRLGASDDRWQVALIGRNLSNVYRARFVSQVPLTGISSRTGTTTTGGVSDYSGQINRGREIRLQLTFKIG